MVIYYQKTLKNGNKTKQSKYIYIAKIGDAEITATYENKDLLILEVKKKDGIDINLPSGIKLSKTIYYHGEQEIVGNKNSLGHLGIISEEFESNGNPATISTGKGDLGGKSYGAWQFASNSKVPQSFVKWLKQENFTFYNLLSNAISLDNNTLGKNFDETWKSLGKNKKQNFWELQHKFTKNKYYDEGVKNVLKYLNYDISKTSFAMQNVLWSCAVQHGPGGRDKEDKKYVGAVLFYSKTDLHQEESKIISDIYDERSKVDIYFKKSSAEVKAGVKARFIKEKKKALDFLKKEKKL